MPPGKSSPRHHLSIYHTSPSPSIFIPSLFSFLSFSISQPSSSSGSANRRQEGFKKGVEVEDARRRRTTTTIQVRFCDKLLESGGVYLATSLSISSLCARCGMDGEAKTRSDGLCGEMDVWGDKMIRMSGGIEILISGPHYTLNANIKKRFGP